MGRERAKTSPARETVERDYPDADARQALVHKWRGLLSASAELASEVRTVLACYFESCARASTEWVFTGLDRAYYNALNGGRLMICHACVEKAVEALENGQDTTA